MYSRSAGAIVGCASGSAYMRFQASTQRNPTAPGTRNAACQPWKWISKPTSGGATIAPMPVPAVTMPVASERSCAGNHSATAFSAAGKFTASVRPRNPRSANRLRNPLPNAWSMAATLHQTTARLNERRVPSLSITGPSATWPSAYVIRNAYVIQPYWVLVRPNSARTTGAATDSACRSM